MKSFRTGTPNSDNLVFWGTAGDKEYLPYLKGCVAGATTFVRLDKITTLTEVKMYCETRKITGIISTSIPLLCKLLHWQENKLPSLDSYAGSLFTIPASTPDGDDIEVVFIVPLKRIVMPITKFLTERYINKLVRKQMWMEDISFDWKVLNPEDVDEAFGRLSNAFLIAIDIETFRDNARIRCISYCGFFYESDGSISAYAYVLPVDSVYNLTVMKRFNWELKAPKVLQNGKYDMSYLCRYNAPVYAWYWDTATMFHSWYSELPKDLGALNAFFNRKSMYWKDMSKTTDLYEYYHYNAKDTFATGFSLLAMILESPQWAKDNYYIEFPNLFPCHLAEMTGIKRDMVRLKEARLQQDLIDTELTDSLRTILGEPNFNPGSSKQCKQLLILLGCKDIAAKSSDEKSLKKASYRHPLNQRILGLILKIRKARKLKSTYLTVDEKAKEFKGRILFSLNPHGTDTGRLASKEHHFWCGLQIQNIPRPNPESDIPYSLTKSTLMADEGFFLAEVDLEQAESRDTAYISGDPTLIDAVENSPDFHSSNASKFFGVPFEDIFDIATGKVINKPLRQIGKPVNHGANYNMGAYVLIDTMGEEKIIEARNLLGLPRVWTLKEVAEHLLEQFHKTYPQIRDTMYKGIVNEVVGSKMLKSMALHHPHTSAVEMLDSARYNELLVENPSWTRYCFGNPTKSKPVLNSYVAHPPQNLNAMTLNKAWQKVFHEIAIHPDHMHNFKLVAQVHDSILFQYREGHEYLCEMVKEMMEIPVTIKGYDNKIRTFTVPAGVKAGINNTPTKYWSETE